MISSGKDFTAEFYDYFKEGILELKAEKIQAFSLPSIFREWKYLCLQPYKYKPLEFFILSIMIILSCTSSTANADDKFSYEKNSNDSKYCKIIEEFDNYMPENEKFIDQFIQMAHSAEYCGKNNKLHCNIPLSKRIENFSVSVVGFDEKIKKDDDLMNIFFPAFFYAAEIISAISGLEIKLKKFGSNIKENFVNFVFFGEKDRFKIYSLPVFQKNYLPEINISTCFYTSRYNKKGEINAVDIFISKDNLVDFLPHCVLEEMFNSMGLNRDPIGRNSIFSSYEKGYRGNIHKNKNSEVRYAPIDIALLYTLYNDNFSVGQSLNDSKRDLENMIKEKCSGI